MEFTTFSKVLGCVFLFVIVGGFLQLVLGSLLGRLMGGPRREVERQLGIDEEER